MKHYTVVLTPRAERQLNTLYVRIADDGGQARADHYVDRIVADYAVQEELCGPDLYQNGFRERCRQVIQEDADRWQQALPVGNESRDRGIASKPGRQHPPQGSRSNFVATDIAGQRDNAETGDRRLLQADHVVTQEPGRQWHDHLLRFARMTKLPNGSNARAHHEQRRVAAKTLRCVRCFVCIEI
jgi:plasmid stabilization system protein ParE